MTEKELAYMDLIRKRKAFKFAELLNPSEIEGGLNDGDHVELWARWMGNLNAKIMLVGKDFGGKAFFIRFKGYCDPNSVTNRNLMMLFSCIGIDIGNPSNPNNEAPVFFTNSIFGIIDSDSKGKNRISTRSKQESAREFLQPLVHIIDPKIIIAMGKEACECLSFAINLPTVFSMVHALEASPLKTRDSRLVFPVFHCGGLGVANRPLVKQLEDWKRIKPFYENFL